MHGSMNVEKKKAVRISEQNCELRVLYFSRVIITVTKSRRIIWERPVVIRQRREIHTGSRCAKGWERDRFEELAT
jgi:hypothetical protein